MDEEIYQAPLYKRIIAALLDNIIVVLLAIGIFMLLVNGAVDIGFHNLNYKLNQYKLQEESSLFYVSKDEKGNFVEIKSITYELKDHEGYKTFVSNIHSYYQNYVTLDTKSEAEFNKKYMLFDEKTYRNAIFSINSLNDEYSTYTLLDEVKDVTNNRMVKKENEEQYYEAIYNFFTDKTKGVYNLALTEFTNSEKFNTLVKDLEAIERIEALICVSVSSLFIAIPVLINKNGETAFMHVLGITFSDSAGYKVKWRNKIIRSIMIILLNASSTYLFAIPLVVNSLLCLFTPNNRSLIDYASNETAIDKKTSIILEN